MLYFLNLGLFRFWKTLVVKFFNKKSSMIFRKTEQLFAIESWTSPPKGHV